MDGLNTAIYKIHTVVKEPLFTRIIASFSGPVTMKEAVNYFRMKHLNMWKETLMKKP